MSRNKRKYAAEAGLTDQTLRYRNRAQHSAFYELKEVRPKDGWERAAAGIMIASGDPVLRQGRQAGYGIVMDEEKNVESITYNKLRKITGLDITEENYRSFIPQKTMEEFNRLAQHSPVRVSKEDCICKEPDRNLDYFYVRTSRAFGADVALFNRYEDGYHAFYVANAPGSWLPSESGFLPSLEDINKMFSHLYWDGDLYDRILTEEEVCWFRNMFFRATNDPDAVWNDMYGRSHTEYKYAVNGEQFSFSRNTKFSAELQKCLVNLAQGGIEIR